MEPQARHDLRHPVATMFLIGSAAHAIGTELGHNVPTRFRDEMLGELRRFRALVRRHRVAIDVSELACAVAAFALDPASPARGLSVQRACQSVLGELGLNEDGRPIELEADGVHASEG